MSWRSFTDKYSIKDGLIGYNWQVVSPHALWLRGQSSEPQDYGKIKIPVFAKDTNYSPSPIAFTYPVPSR